MAKGKKSPDAPSIETVEAPVANANTTDIQVPETMHIETAPEKPPEAEAKERFDPRKDIMAEIVKNRQKVVADELQLAVDMAEPVTEEPPESAPEPAEALPSQPGKVAAEPAAGTVVAEPAAGQSTPEKYKIIVDGQAMEYTIDELKQQAQLGVGARKRFEEAAEMRRQAENLMFAQPRQNLPPEPAANTNMQPQNPDIPEAELRDIAKRMNYGSEEEQVKALKDAGILFSKQQVRQDMPTPEQLVNAATQNALSIIEVRNEQALLKDEFKEIIADPALAMATDVIATQLFQKYQALGQPKSRLELLREAGQTAKDRYLKMPVVSPQEPNKPTVTQTVAPMTEKLERKRAAPQPPSAASKVAHEATREPRYSAGSIVAQMRKARGQAAY